MRAMIRPLLVALTPLLWLGGGMLTPATAQVVLPQSYETAAVKTDAQTRARLHTELASLYMQAENMPVALEESGIAIEADPNYAPAYNMRALVYMALNESAAAEADFKRALAIAPNDPEISNNYGWFLCQKGSPAESIPYFMIAVKNPLYSTPGRAYTNAATCAILAGDLDAGTDYLQRAARLYPEGNLPIALQFAKLAYLRGNLTEARALTLEVIGAMPQPTAEALWLGVRIERKLGNQKDEASLSAQLRRLYPASTEYQALLKGHYE